HILADVARLSQTGRIGDRKRHLQKAREGLGQEGLARSGWPKQQDVAFLELNIPCNHLAIYALVVIVNRNRQDLFCPLLADYVLVKDSLDFGWLGNIRRRALILVVVNFLGDNIITQVDAFVAKINCRTRYQLANLVLALAAKGTD